MTLVVQIERVVGAKQTAADRIECHGDGTLIASQMNGAADRAVFDCDGRGGGRKNAWAGVAYGHPAVDDVTIAAYFFGADEKARRSVRVDPAVDGRAARN